MKENHRVIYIYIYLEHSIFQHGIMVLLFPILWFGKFGNFFHLLQIYTKKKIKSNFFFDCQNAENFQKNKNAA